MTGQNNSQELVAFIGLEIHHTCLRLETVRRKRMMGLTTRKNTSCVSSDVQAQLGLALRAWAWLLRAWASKNLKLGPMPRYGLGSGLAWLKPRAFKFLEEHELMPTPATLSVMTYSLKGALQPRRWFLIESDGVETGGTP
jgi:hypothetical protein